MIRIDWRHALALQVLLTFVFFVGTLAPGVATAKNPYEMHQATEGDPGDGVLEPVAPAPQQTDDLTDTAGGAVAVAPIGKQTALRYGFLFAVFPDSRLQPILILPELLYRNAQQSGFALSGPIFSAGRW